MHTDSEPGTLQNARRGLDHLMLTTLWRIFHHDRPIETEARSCQVARLGSELRMSRSSIQTTPPLPLNLCWAYHKQVSQCSNLRCPPQKSTQHLLLLKSFPSRIIIIVHLIRPKSWHENFHPHLVEQLHKVFQSWGNSALLPSNTGKGWPRFPEPSVPKLVQSLEDSISHVLRGRNMLLVLWIHPWEGLLKLWTSIWVFLAQQCLALIEELGHNPKSPELDHLVWSLRAKQCYPVHNLERINPVTQVI